PRPRLLCLPRYRLRHLPQGPQRPMAEMDRNSRLQLPALEEFLTCLFPFVWLSFSFRPPTRSMVSTGKSSVRSLAFPMFCRELDINSAEHCENERLEQAYQKLKEVERERK